MSRRLRLVLLFFLLLATLLGGVGWFFLTSEQGLQFLWRQARPYLPETLSIERLQGRLSGPLVLRGVRYQDAQQRLSLSELELRWRPAALLAGRLELDRLDLSGLTLVHLGPSESSPMTLPDSIELPFSLDLRAFSLQQAAYLSAPDAEPFELQEVRFSAKADGREITLSRLALKAPLLDVAGDARLQNGRGYALDGHYQWQLRLPEYPPMDGVTVLGGSLQKLSINQTLAAPYNARADIILDQPLGEARFDARLNLEAVALQSLRTDMPPYTLDARISAAGDAAEGRFSALLDTSDPTLGSLHADLNGGYDGVGLLLDRLVLTMPDHAATAEVSGRVLLDQAQPVAELKGSWQGLRWPLQGEPVIESPRGAMEINGSPDDLSAEVDMALAGDGRIQGQVGYRQQQLDVQLDWRSLAWPQSEPRVKSPEGRLQASGGLEDYRFSVDGQIDVPGQTGGRIDLQGSGGSESIQLSKLHFTTLGGYVQGSAEVGWQPAVRAKLDLRGQDLDPGGLFEGWGGRLGLTIDADVEMRGEQLVAQARRLTLAGELRGYPVNLEAQGRFDDQGLRLNSATLVSGTTRLEASGLVGETLDLDWQVSSEDLVSLSPKAAGRLRGKGRLGGRLAAPRILANLQGSKLAYAGHSLETLSLNADLHADGGSASHFELDLKNASLADVRVERVRLDGTGRPAEHRLHMETVSNRGSGELEVVGELQEDSWRFGLREGQLAYPGLAPWVLSAPASGALSLDGQRVSVARNCWTSSGAELCFAGSRSTQQMRGEFELKALPFGYFAALLPGELRWEGELGGRGSLQGSPAAENLQADIALTSSAGRLLSLSDGEEEQPVLAFAAGRAGLKLQGDALKLEVDLPFVTAGGLEMDAKVPAGQGSLIERRLSGQLRLGVPDIAVFTDLLPELEKVGGRLQGEVKLGGTLRSPVFGGRLTLTDGAAELIAPGITLSSVQAQLVGQDDGNIQVSLEATSGQGRLQARGTAKMVSGALAADLAISGQNFQVLDIPEAEVRVSPDLKVRVAGARVAVDGDLRVPYARVRVRTLPDTAVAPSGDQVIVGKQPAAGGDTTEPRQIDARVRLLLGDRVTFDGFGLKARFEGNLLLLEQPGRLTTATGEISIPEGTYRAYGQNLAIERGYLRFAGGLVTEPGLDVRAIRRPAPGVLVGVQIRGTLKKPEFELFSEPAMSQTEQLSYLVLGRPLDSGTSSEENNAMTRAALALGLAGGGTLAESFGDQLGFDTVGIEKGKGESTEEAALVVGKFLSPKLYVSYGIGLFEPVSTIWLRYSIDENWKVVTESSTRGSGADIYYTIDRGR